VGGTQNKKDRMAGKAKEVPGKAAGDRRTEAEGRAEQFNGQPRDLADDKAQRAQRAQRSERSQAAERSEKSSEAHKSGEAAGKIKKMFK
jgi:uncharacterized protein YjbJ (UPF0337 family)